MRKLLVSSLSKYYNTIDKVLIPPVNFTMKQLAKLMGQFELTKDYQEVFNFIISDNAYEIYENIREQKLNSLYYDKWNRILEEHFRLFCLTTTYLYDQAIADGLSQETIDILMNIDDQRHMAYGMIEPFFDWLSEKFD